MRSPESVLIIDDHEQVARNLKFMIECSYSGLQLCDYATCGHTAASYYNKITYQLAIVDLTFDSGPDGLHITQNLLATCPTTRVIIQSMHDEAVFAVRAIQAGASGYVMKSAAGEAMSKAIEAVLSDKLYVSPEISDRVLRQISMGHNPSTPKEALTPREQQVLHLIGKRKSRSDIAHDMGVAPETVSTWRARITKKLGLKSGELNEYAWQQNSAVL
jgi:two-component system, NarL family, invasion response regulator UvrY